MLKDSKCLRTYGVSKEAEWLKNSTDNQPTVTISNIIDSLRLNPNNCVSRQGEQYGKTHS